MEMEMEMEADKRYVQSGSRLFVSYQLLTTAYWDWLLGITGRRNCKFIELR